MKIHFKNAMEYVGFTQDFAFAAPHLQLWSLTGVELHWANFYAEFVITRKETTL